MYWLQYQCALLHTETITLYNYQTDLNQGHRKSALWIMCPSLKIFCHRKSALWIMCPSLKIFCHRKSALWIMCPSLKIICHRKSALWIMCPSLKIFYMIPVTLNVNISHQPVAVVFLFSICLRKLMSSGS